jgi:hypothetical protein
MSIVLRVNKGAALTYDEMDRNQSQFYYSSSLHTNNTILRLHYTGSVALADGGVDYSPRYHSIPISTGDIEIPAATAAGNPTEIQFNYGGIFGADSLFVFNEDKNYLGIGTASPQGRLHIVADNSYGAEATLQGLSYTSGLQPATAAVVFKEGSNLIGKIGRTKTDEPNYDLFISNSYIVNTPQKQYGKIRFAVKGNTNNEYNTLGTFSYNGNTAKLGVGVNAVDPARNISLVGNDGIGFSKTTDYTLASYISPLPSGADIDLVQPDGSNKGSGLLISAPKTLEGGNIVLNINTDINEREGFNIVKSTQSNFSTSEVIASFQASGKVGINTNFPSDVGLTVAGIISGSGNAQIDGTLTVGTVAAVTATGTNKTLVTDSNGLVNYLPAAPVPFGGIIMWSGNTNAVPEGWVLCNLNNSVTTSLGTRFVPDLTNKFIIGWNGDEAGSGPKTDITGTDTVSGGSKDAVLIQHNHGGTITGGNHRHAFEDGYYIEAYESPNDIINGYDSQLVGNNFRGSGDTDADNRYIWERDSNTSYSTHSHTIPNDPTTAETGVNKNLPPYYALAFIMYVGV